MKCLLQYVHIAISFQKQDILQFLWTLYNSLKRKIKALPAVFGTAGCVSHKHPVYACHLDPEYRLNISTIVSCGSR